MKTIQLYLLLGGKQEIHQETPQAMVSSILQLKIHLFAKLNQSFMYAHVCVCVCVCTHKGFSSLIRNSLHVFLNSVLITPTPRNFKQLDKLPTYTLRGALTVVRFSPRASHPVGKHDTHMHG